MHFTKFAKQVIAVVIFAAGFSIVSAQAATLRPTAPSTERMPLPPYPGAGEDETGK